MQNKELTGDGIIVDANSKTGQFSIELSNLSKAGPFKTIHFTPMNGDVIRDIKIFKDVCFGLFGLSPCYDSDLGLFIDI